MSNTTTRTGVASAGALQGERESIAARRRRSRRRRPHPISVALTLAPMIDMSFTFLIFFVVTTRFLQPEGILGSKMPRAAGQSLTPAVALPVTPIIVRLSASGPKSEGCAIGIDLLPGAAPASFADLAQALRDLRQHPGFDVETPVVIVAGDEVRWDHVVSCWNAALRAECKNIAFAGT